MKNLLILLSLFLVSAFSLQAQRDYQQGDVVYILAPNGLNIRSTAGISGEKIGKALFKEPVTVIGYGQTPQAFSYAGIDGHWLKIDFLGMKGYVFDGFVSRFPITHIYKDMNIPSFVKRNFQAKGSPKITKEMVDGFGELSKTVQKYSAKKDPTYWFELIEVEEEITSETIIRLPKTSLAEAFNLGKALDENFSGTTLKKPTTGNHIKLDAIGSQKQRFQSFEYHASGKIKAVKIHYLHDAGSCWMIVRNANSKSVDLVFGCHDN